MSISRDLQKKLEQLSDIDVIKIILNKGKREFLEVLYDRYSGKVFYKCVKITNDREVSKDLAHDIMVKVFVNLAKFRGTSAFSLWVHSITYNHCMDYLKKKKLYPESIEANDHDKFAGQEDELEHKILLELKLNQLEILLEKISQEDKLLLMMRYQDNIAVKQIAKILSIGESSVKMRLKRSRDKLARLFKEIYPDER